MQLREALIVSFVQFVSSNPLTSAKGQLIFKCPFSVFKSSKIPTKKNSFAHKNEQEYFCIPALASEKR